ncbi:unnamed protein product, partial [Ectocarpus sp. 6 AP-2014]
DQSDGPTPAPVEADDPTPSPVNGADDPTPSPVNGVTMTDDESGQGKWIDVATTAQISLDTRSDQSDGPTPAPVEADDPTPSPVNGVTMTDDESGQG